MWPFRKIVDSRESEPQEQERPETTDSISHEDDVSQVAIKVLFRLLPSSETPEALAKRAYDIAFAMLEETNRRDN